MNGILTDETILTIHKTHLHAIVVQLVTCAVLVTFILKGSYNIDFKIYI